MRIKWIGLLAVVLIAMSIIVVKERTHHTQTVVVHGSQLPTVLLVADLSEANSEDNCARIIHDVRAAQARGISVEELNPNSPSNLLQRYKVLVIPTVLVLDKSGKVVSRYEGEDGQTTAAVHFALEQLKSRHP